MKDRKLKLSKLPPGETNSWSEDTCLPAMENRVVFCQMLWFIALCVTIFWRRGWPRSHPYRHLISSNRPAVWVPSETEAKHDYNITSMPVELLLTIANKLCYFTLSGRLFKTSSLPYQTLGPLTWTCSLRRTRTSLLRRAYNSKDIPFTRLIKCQTNQ